MVLFLQKDQIQAACIDICKDSIVEISRVTQVVKTHLVPFSDVLTRVWSLRKKSSDIFKTCSMVNHTLFQALQERSTMLKSLSAVSSFSCVDYACSSILVFIRVPLHKTRRPRQLQLTMYR